MHPKISIIIPIFNASKTLERLLNAVCAQSFNDYEVILINDGSTDDSEKVCIKFERRNSRIHYLYQKNLGVSSARNRGIENAAGEYLLFVDSDDYIPSDALQTLIAKQAVYDEYLICGSHVMKKTRNREINYLLDDYLYLKTNYEEFYSALDKIPTAPWGKLFKRSVVIDNNLSYPLGIPFGEDAIFLYKYLNFVKGIVTFDQIVYVYSFLDTNSAGRKYYKEYSKYMRMQMESKAELIKNVSDVKLDETELYFERCLEHYIINENNAYELKKRIYELIEEFPEAVSNLQYGKWVQLRDVMQIVKAWKRKHLKKYCMEKFKMYMESIKSRNIKESENSQ